MISTEINKIAFKYIDVSFYFPNRSFSKKAILKIFDSEKIDLNAVNYLFCSDDYLLRLNKKFLSHDTYTDILSFQYSKKAEPVFAEIFISIDRVKENAKLYADSFLHELHRVMFHGALHLCGYKDKTKSELKTMKSKENFYLAQYVPRETNKR